MKDGPSDGSVSGLPHPTRRARPVLAAMLTAAALLSPDAGAQSSASAPLGLHHDQKSDSAAVAHASPATAAASPDGPYFHLDLPYGSEAYAGPLDVLLNKGLGLTQVSNRTQRVFGAEYGWGSVWDALANPVAAVERSGGWGPVIRREVLPLSADPHFSAWYPNYFGHLIEGGITARRLNEWFEARGAPAPWLLSAVTTMGAAVLNEAYESGAARGSASKVVDLYFFDPLGIALFSSDRVARFFSRALNARVWPAQASFALPSGELLNNANHLVMKLDVLPTDEVSLFFRTGLGAQLGPTIHGDGGLDWSLAVGSDASRHHVDPATGVESVEIAWSGALYVDRKGSLLASLAVSRLNARAVTLNIYPGVVHEELGGWLNVTGDGRLQVGLTSRRAPGLGLGLGF